MKAGFKLVLVLLSAVFLSCKDKTIDEPLTEAEVQDTLNEAKIEAPEILPKTAKDIGLQKELTFDNHTLEDTYPYKDTTRVFQWEKIKEKLAYVENFQREKITYAILQNYKNKNGEAPTVKNFVRNDYTRVSDTLGVERYQSAPLYVPGESQHPVIYGRDGSVVRLISSDTLDMVQIQGISFSGTWDVPKRYVKTLGDSIRFNHIVFVDVTNQNITLIEKSEERWLIRSANPSTTGVHKPPYAMETPVGMFIIQENKPKMFYQKDGSTEIEGFAPYASRFTNGGYIHGVPTNNPKGNIIEYSATLGTIPRSHMCVRTPSSHAKFIYDSAKPLQSLVFVID
ncbi:MAG: L,D-transpeptidase [Flavobacteriaceae bacterium]